MRKELNYIYNVLYTLTVDKMLFSVESKLEEVNGEIYQRPAARPETGEKRLGELQVQNNKSDVETSKTIRALAKRT